MKNHYRWMRGILFAGAMALLLSCGGGGSGGGGSAGSLGGIAGSGATGSGSDGAGTGGGGNDGSGSTGGTGSAGGSDGTSTAGNGSDDGSGVGSGGTGVSTADATGIGSVGGLGSIILNGVRYNTDAATTSLEDAAELQIGMSVRIAGKIDSEFTAATAQQVDSAAELRGAVSAIVAGAGSFAVMGTTVTIDNATIWSGANSLAQIAIGSVVQVWGLPSAPGTLRATRVELKPTSPEPLVTGVVQNLDRIGQRFTLGLLTVRYGSAAFSGGIDLSTLADGAIVRVRGSAAPVADVFTATKVQGWYAVPTQNAAAVQLAGVITNYGGLNAFKVLGTAVDASNAIVTGGPASSIGDGVKVELDGFMTNGVLVVKKLRIRYIPGTGGPVAFTLIGAIGDYVSPSSFVVKGQKVNASSPATVFENGSAADLANGRRVTVVGNAVVDGVLTAQTVTFLTP
ncbi:hypothetical protein J2W37_004703 [Variovorax paradoxus]|uniref:DUF5666 domain-containing protein n=1 Tax=Variovorax paradoxus TaxID=34073 RepID=A0AAE3Y4W7_VARPD|nr:MULTISPECIES: DUF5666 domain-containing protein [Variovorax]MBD9665358.1 hypothetical protein [Variovorax sp. VRV01]MDP9966961.1 hypothetical protein [Variovorax paradoxus]MDR6429629.1 hypothetical protein [Variovorax paradoxus]